MQLLDGSKVEPYIIPVTIKAELRKYQQDGVNWLAFLAKYHLHGILCDGESVKCSILVRLTECGPRYGPWQDSTIHMHFIE